MNLLLIIVSVGVKVNSKGRGESDVQKNKIRGMQNKLQHTHTVYFSTETTDIYIYILIALSCFLGSSFFLCC